jgi:hypothetical protein
LATPLHDHIAVAVGLRDGGDQPVGMHLKQKQCFYLTLSSVAVVQPF